jgi:NAD dependent epimerase/dehydratase
MGLLGKRVLVTGAGGFIGSHLAEVLAREGAAVRAFVRYVGNGGAGFLDASSERAKMDIIRGDIRDPYFVAKAAEGVDVIFHLAALIAIPYSYEAAESYVSTNIQGTVNVLEAARTAGVSRILHTSTSEVYGTADYVPIDEKHPLKAQSPYSATKIGADAMATSYARAFGLPVTIVRPFNTYGPRQSARAVIPTIMTQLLAGRRTISLGALTPTRDLVFVENTCAAFVALATCETAIGEVVNVGTGVDMSIGDLARKISALAGVEAEISSEAARLRPETSEVERLRADAAKLKALTGFAPTTTLDEGLAKTWAWFSNPENLKRYDAVRYNV